MEEAGTDKSLLSVVMYSRREIGSAGESFLSNSMDFLRHCGMRAAYCAIFSFFFLLYGTRYEIVA